MGSYLLATSRLTVFSDQFFDKQLRLSARYAKRPGRLNHTPGNPHTTTATTLHLSLKTGFVPTSHFFSLLSVQIGECSVKPLSKPAAVVLHICYIRTAKLSSHTDGVRLPLSCVALPLYFPFHDFRQIVHLVGRVFDAIRPPFSHTLHGVDKVRYKRWTDFRLVIRRYHEPKITLTHFNGIQFFILSQNVHDEVCFFASSFVHPSIIMTSKSVFSIFVLLFYLPATTNFILSRGGN